MLLTFLLFSFFSIKRTYRDLSCCKLIITLKLRELKQSLTRWSPVISRYVLRTNCNTVSIYQINC